MTDQRIPLEEREMVQNAAGGYAFKAEDFVALDRWLLAGTNDNLFRQSNGNENPNYDTLLNCIAKNPALVAERIVYASEHGLKNNIPLRALAVLSSDDNPISKKAFRESFNKVIRTASHLYEFLEYVKETRGFGKTIHRSVDGWFKSRKDIEYQLLKYQSRNGWEARDVLRKFHVIPTNATMNSIFKWSVKGWNELDEKERSMLKQVPWFESIKNDQSEDNVINAIRKGGLTWEMVIGNCQKMTYNIWWELFKVMPLTATIRYLATLTANGIFRSEGNIKLLRERLTNKASLKAAKIHPIAIAKALSMYASNGLYSEHSKLVYTAVPEVIGILEEALELSSTCIESTGKNIIVSVDVSGSMWNRNWGGEPFNYGGLFPAQIAGMIALSISHAEKDVEIMSFDTSYKPLPISGMSFHDVLNRNNGVWPHTYGGTDASLAYTYAANKDKVVDAFICITDNESWAGGHPSEALSYYRKKVNNNAKAIYVTLKNCDKTTLVDPVDSNSYDIVGFSDETVKLIQLILNDEF